MAWAFQSVLNACLQILLSIASGWLCGRLHLVDPDALSASLNAFAMKACLPAFVLHLLGIKADLTDLAAWRALGAFVLWVALIQLGCLAWHKLHKVESMQQLGMHCLLLTTNNTGFIGWPVLVATIGAKGATLSMLLSVLLFIQLLPAAVACFEYQKFIDQEAKQQSQDHTTALPLTANPPLSSQAPLLQDPVKSTFPHEYRYCYWTNSDYVPAMNTKQTASNADDSGSKSSQCEPLTVMQQQQQQLQMLSAAASNSTSGSDSRLSTRKGPEQSPSSSRYWWWWRGNTLEAAAALKRSKDSSTSQHTPLVTDLHGTHPQQLQQNPGARRGGMTTLTRRMSRGLSARATAADMSRDVDADCTPRATAALTSSLPSPVGAAAPNAAEESAASAAAYVAVRGKERSPVEQVACDSATELSFMYDSSNSKQQEQQRQQGVLPLVIAPESIQQPGNATCYITAAGPQPGKGTSGITVPKTQGETLHCNTVEAGGLADKNNSSRRPQWFGRFMIQHPLLCHVVAVQLQSPLMWLNFIAIAMSLSGLRLYLDPGSPSAIPALGFIDGVLSWFSSACIPVTLFANGVWMADKNVFGGKQGQIEVTQLLLLKLFVLPALMVGVTQLCGLKDANGLSLVLLASCPLAQLAFLLCHQYKAGAELATSLTIQGVLLMLPHMIAVIKICQVARLYDVPGLSHAG